MFLEAMVCVLVSGQIMLTHPNQTDLLSPCACRGELIQSLGSKARECAQNLTLKARKVLTKWPTMLQDGGATKAALWSCKPESPL